MLRAGLFVCALALAPLPALAQSGNDEQARALYAEGDRHYNEGRYELAVQAFQRAYELSGRPLLLFNLANAYERLGRYYDALQALRGYAPHAPPNETAQVTARISALEQRAAEFGQTSAGSGGSSTNDALLIPGVALLGAGALLGVGGIVTAVLALDAQAAAADGCVASEGQTFCDAEVRGSIDDGFLFALLADIGIFAGSAIVVTGVLLVVLGVSLGPEGGGEEAAEETAVLPYFVPRSGGGELGAVVSF